MAPQAQPSIPRPIRLFLRQLRASHLGGELEGESQKLLVGYQGCGCRHSWPLCPGYDLSTTQWPLNLDMSIFMFLVPHRHWGSVLCS